MSEEEQRFRGRDTSGGYYLLDLVRARANPGDVERLLRNTAEQDGPRVRIGFGQDPGQAGKELFRVLEGFPDLAHDDEVDACSGALERLNPRMKSWGSYELMRRRVEELKQQSEPQPPKKEWARGSVEWQAEQDKLKSGPIPATPAEQL